MKRLMQSVGLGRHRRGKARCAGSHRLRQAVRKAPEERRDAEAICKAALRPTMRFVAVKSEVA